MSHGVESRPIGMVAMKRLRFSGVSGTPMKASNSPVSPITGQIALTRMLSPPSSTASDFDIKLTAPFELLYQVRPGRGRMPAVEPILRITPWRAFLISGTTAWTMWKIDLTLTA